MYVTPGHDIRMFVAVHFLEVKTNGHTNTGNTQIPLGYRMNEFYGDAFHEC